MTAYLRAQKHPKLSHANNKPPLHPIEGPELSATRDSKSYVRRILPHGLLLLGHAAHGLQTCD